MSLSNVDLSMEEQKALNKKLLALRTRLESVKIKDMTLGELMEALRLHKDWSSYNGDQTEKFSEVIRKHG